MSKKKTRHPTPQRAPQDHKSRAGKVTAIRAEANSDAQPAGTPELLPLTALDSRKTRTIAIHHMAEAGRHYDAIEAGSDNDLERLEHAAAVAEAAEALILTVAIDPQAAARWASKATDEQVAELFGWWMRVSQPGEASSSSH